MEKNLERLNEKLNEFKDFLYFSMYQRTRTGRTRTLTRLSSPEILYNRVGSHFQFNFEVQSLHLSLSCKSLENYFWKSEGRKRVLAKYQFEIE